ncbi:MAG: hypothetical protein KKD35_08635 [Elusimicrobia bacterium]|nr:hypothetical protein [Elusimicrobiota bacterium]
MDELNNFKKLLDDIRDGEPEEQNSDISSAQKINKGPVIARKSIGKPVLKTYSPSCHKTLAKYTETKPLWCENKELVLFSLLASAVLSIVGILSLVDYLTIVGAIGFLLSSIAIFLLMFNYATSVKKDAPLDDNIQMKIDELSRKIESTNLGDFSSSSFAPTDEKVQEMEGKIEELRTIVKTLMQAVGNTPR